MIDEIGLEAGRVRGMGCMHALWYCRGGKCGERNYLPVRTLCSICAHFPIMTSASPPPPHAHMPAHTQLPDR